MTNFRSLIAASAAIIMGFAAFAEDIEITVEAGQTVTRDDVISGEGKLIKKGAGTLILTAANTYSGGTELQAGIIEIRNKDAFGTGEVVINGSTEQANQVVFGFKGSESNPIPNAFMIASSSSLAYPAMHFANNTYIGGAVQANGNFYMSTAWGDKSGQSREGNVKFISTVTVADGFCVGGAPHCMVLFKAKLKTPLLDCCYVPNGQASNGGNAGFFELVNDGNEIDKININQTGIYCYNKGVCTNTVVEWLNVADNLRDDVGRFEVRRDQSIGDIITPVIAKGGEGCIITNISSAAVTFAVIGCPVARDCYARFDGLIDFQYLRTLNKNEAYFTFKNRRHLMKGEMYNNRSRIVIGEGASIPYVTKISNSQSVRFNVTSGEEDVLDGMRTVAIGSTTYTFNETAVKSLSKSLQCALTRTTGTLTLSGSTPLQVKSFYCGETGYKFYYPAGEYTPTGSDTTYRFNYENPSSIKLTGTVLVWGDNSTGTRTGWTNMVWAGASTASSNVNDLANWEELPQYVTFKVPAAWVKFAAVDGYASLTNDVHWGGLTFTADTTNFTLKSEENDPTINLYDNGLVIEKGEGDEALQIARAFTIEPKLYFMNEQTTFTVPANDTLTLEQPILGETLTKAGDGRLVIGGEIPLTNTISGGTLEFASGATLPADDTMVLTIAEGAKISVPQGTVLRVKTLTYAGAAVPVGLYQGAAYIDGDGKIFITESSSAEITPETITWNCAGDSGAFSSAANWDPIYVNLGWANKYTTVFAKEGVEATGVAVDGAYSLVGLQIANTLGNFTFKESGDTSSLALGTGGLTVADGRATATERTITFETPVTMSAAWAPTIPANDTVAFTNGLTMAKALTKNGAGKLVLDGASRIVGDSTISAGTFDLSGTLSGSGKLTLKTAASDADYSICLNEAHFLKELYCGTAQSGKYRIRSTAPVGSTNYIHKISDNGSVTTCSEYGRVFVISNFNVYAKHTLDVCGSSADGPTKIIGLKATQSYRSEHTGHLTVNSGVDLSISSDSGLNSNQLKLNAGGVIRFLTDNLFASASAVKAERARFILDGGDAYLGTTHQRFSMVNGAAAATIHGDWGSEIEIMVGTNVSSSANIKCNISGSVSLTMNGPLTNWVNGVSTTDGALSVKQGTLNMASNSKMENLRAINVSGGLLWLRGYGDQFGRSSLALTVTGGSIRIENASSTLWCGSATVNGEPVAKGTYTATNLGAFEGYLEGDGKIRVGSGTIFIIK